MFKFIFTLCVSLIFSSFAFADKLPGNIALHIAKSHYQHPVRLLHPYIDAWHMKGPLAEKAAIKTFGKRFANSSMCSDSSNADVVLLLEPHMFYNPQLRVFHGEIILKVFTNSTEPVATIKKQAQQDGWLDIKPEFYMEKAYIKAMDKVIKKLEMDKAFLDALARTSARHAEHLCSSLDDLPLAKKYY